MTSWNLLYLFLCTLALPMLALGQSTALLFSGTVVNDQGLPIPSAQVQFWHTDVNGNYNHPSFNTRGMDLVQGFQYFGTATTDDQGSYEFRTIRPGIYSARPMTHIHFKVFVSGSETLTSQFYFKDEGNTQFSDLLQLELESNKTVVILQGGGGSLTATPSQAEGPYYPVVDFFDLDSDMLNVTVQEEKAVFVSSSSSSSGTPTAAAAAAGETTSAPTAVPAKDIDSPTVAVVDASTSFSAASSLLVAPTTLALLLLSAGLVLL